MTSQGSAHGRFTRAIQQRNLWAAEMSLRELGQPSLEAALSYLALLAEVKPEKLERAGRGNPGGPEHSTAALARPLPTIYAKQATRFTPLNDVRDAPGTMRRCRATRLCKTYP